MQRLRNDGKPIELLSQAATWLSQIARALEHMHGKGWVHHDLQEENIFLEDDGRAVLGDFGVSSKEGDLLLESTGTTGYIAMEMLKADILPQSETDRIN